MFYDFEKDLPTGENGEEIVARTLYEYKGWFPVKFNKTKEYDILMQPEGPDTDLIKVEVKTDIYPVDTGNMLIEKQNRGKNSGIMTTEADYWAYLYPYHPAQNLWLIKTTELKKLIESNEKKLNVKWVGDMKKALCWLIPVKEYKNHFEVLTAFM
jgi:hypothetical protein